MDEPTRHELQMLRARAYGRAADIAEDPAAQQRLEELEGIARAAFAKPLAEDPPLDREAELETEPETAPEPETEPGAPPQLETVEASSAREALSDETAHRRPLPRSVAALWAVSLIVALFVGVAATVGVSGISALGGGSVRQVATLHAIDDFDWPEFVGVAGTGSAGYDDFYGLTPLRPRGGYFAGGVEQECLLVVFTEDIETGAEYPQGGMFSGCGTGAFPATLQFPVDAGLPDELRERFPEGSALQFVLDGDRVVVFSDAG